MKKSIFALLFLSLIFLPVSVNANHATFVNGCTIFPTTEPAKYVNLKTHVASQVITMDSSIPQNGYLDSITVWAKPALKDQLKAKVTITHLTTPASAGFRATKTVVLERSKVGVFVDYTDFPVVAGALYMLKIEPINSADQIIWQYKDEDCFMMGAAVIDQVHYNRTKDFGFNYVTKHKDPVPLQNPINPPEETEDPVQSDPPVEESADQKPPTTEAPKTETPKTSVPNTTTPPSSNTTTTPKNLEQTIVLAEEENKKRTETNEPQKELTDEDLKLIMAWIKEDYEAHKTKGAFGLGGKMGEIFSWTNIFILGGLALLTTIIIFLRHLKKKKALKSIEKTKS